MEDYEDVNVSEDESIPPNTRTVSSRRRSLYLEPYADQESELLLRKKLSNLELENQDDEEERGENYDGWGIVPDIVIEKIFSYLNIPERYNASMTCKQWQRAFYMQATWNTFELDDSTLTRHKFNYYMGWQLILDHLRTQVCIFRIGRFIRNLVFSPMSNLFNLYEFMNMLSYYSERYAQEDKKSRAPLHIRSLRFIFHLDLTNRAEQQQAVYGTGGKLLEALQRLMTNLKELLNLELIDLLLDSPSEAIHLLDDVVVTLCERLDRFVLINPTKSNLSLLHIGCFINLRILKVTPQCISSDVVELLCNNLYLTEVHLIQNKYTETGNVINKKSWAKAKFKVYLRTIGSVDKEIFWQPGAPTISVIYDSPRTKVSWLSVLTIIELYSMSLEEYGHFGLPRFVISRKFENRPDQMLLTLCRKSPYLKTLYIRENISTSTLLLIASMSPNLEYLHMRKNALILKCDYKQHNLGLDANFTQWLVDNSGSYDRTTREISKILNQPDWTPMTDKYFKEICRRNLPY